MTPRERDHHRVKIAWVVLSVPAVVVTELEGALLLGIGITVIGWLVTIALALRS